MPIMDILPVTVLSEAKASALAATFNDEANEDGDTFVIEAFRGGFVVVLFDADGVRVGAI